MEMLICTNMGSLSQPVLKYGMWLAALLKYPVALLGIVDDPGKRREIEDVIDETSRLLVERGLSCQSLIMEGPAEVVITQEAVRGERLTVVGWLGQSRWRRFWKGGSFRRLMDAIESPLLYVPSARLQLRRILLCTGGLRYAEGVTHVVRLIAQISQAEVTVLHITQPASLHYPPVDELQDWRQDMLESSTPQARYVRRVLEELGEAGIPVMLKRRYGNIVHEIAAEIRDIDYDMIGLGSPYGIRSLRHLFMPNITAQIIEAANLPVLVARSVHHAR